MCLKISGDDALSREKILSNECSVDSLYIPFYEPRNHCHFPIDSVAKIDEMYQAIVLGNAAPRRRRRANVNATDTTVLHYNSRPVAEMQLTVRAADQVLGHGYHRAWIVGTMVPG